MNHIMRVLIIISSCLLNVSCVTAYPGFIISLNDAGRTVNQVPSPEFKTKEACETWLQGITKHENEIDRHCGELFLMYGDHRFESHVGAYSLFIISRNPEGENVKESYPFLFRYKYNCDMKIMKLPMNANVIDRYCSKLLK